MTRRFPIPLFPVIIMVLFAQGAAHAELQSRLGGKAYYDTDRDITWLADANYARTSGYDSDGYMSWSDADAWVQSIVVEGVGGWRLPSSDECVAYCNSSEMGHLFYVELGGQSGSSIEFYHGDNYYLFQNIQASNYWSGTTPSNAALGTVTKWSFRMIDGYQLAYDTLLYYGFAWAVHDGDVGDGGLGGPAVVELYGSDFVGEGSIAEYTVKLLNQGNATLSGPFSVTVEASPGLQFLWWSGVDWSCSAGPQAGQFACTYESDLTPGESSTIDFLYGVAPPYTADCGSGPSPCVSFQATLDGSSSTSILYTAVDNANGVPNGVPRALDDAAFVTYSPVTIDVLNNDWDPDFDQLTVVEIATLPSNGEATIEPNGMITYTPNWGDSGGEDLFRYRITDGKGAFNTAQVNINGVAPSLTTLSSRIDIGQVAVGRLAAGGMGVKGMVGTFYDVRFEPIPDAEIPDALTGTTYDPSSAVSDPNAFRIFPYYGFTDCIFSFTPYCSTWVFFRPSENAGQVSVARAVLTAYSIDDWTRTLPLATAEVVVVGSSSSLVSAPVVAFDDAGSTAAGTKTWIDVLANDQSLAGKQLRVAEVGIQSNMKAYLFEGAPYVWAAGGTLGWVNPLEYTPFPGFAGTDVFHYAVMEECTSPCPEDYTYVRHYGTVTITVQDGNDFSIALSPGSASLTRGATTNYTVNTSVVKGVAETVNLSVSNLPSGVTGSFSPTSVTAGDSSILTLTASSSAAIGTATFTVTGAAAAGAHNATADVTVSEPAANMEISISANPTTVEVGSPIIFTVTAKNLGPDAASNAALSGFDSSSLQGFTDLSVSTTTGSCSGALTTSISCNFGDLPPQASAQVTIQATPTAYVNGLEGSTGVSRSFSANVSATIQDSDTNNNSASITIDITRPSGQFTDGSQPVTQGDVTLTFTGGIDPDGAGFTSVNSSTSAPPLPIGFQLKGSYYEITTSAQFTPPIKICFSGSFTGADQILHYENGTWVSLALLPESTNSMLCVQTNSLSPFAVVFPVTGNRSPIVDAAEDQIVDAKSLLGASVSLLGSASDSDNDTLSFSWSGPCGSASTAEAEMVCPIGSSTMVLTVSDGQVSVEDAVVITVLSARGTKESVLAGLNDLRAKVADEEDGDMLNQAISKLSNSLAPALWVDQLRLDARKGERVFAEEKTCVAILQDMIRENNSVSFNTTLAAFVNRIVGADRLLALVAISDARSRKADPASIALAEEQVAKGDAQISKGLFKEAIDSYRKAWKQTI